MLSKRVLLVFVFIAIARSSSALGHPAIALCGAVCAVAGLALSAVAAHAPGQLLHVRGRCIGRGSCAGATRRRSASETVTWGDEELPADIASTHFMALGTTGAGKTLLLNMLMGSVLPTIGARATGGSRFERRALVYDAKGDLWDTLCDMSTCPVVSLHPFCDRGASWDMGRDVTTPAAALQVAAILIPTDRTGSGNPFFALAARNLVRGVMLSLMQAAGSAWSLRDVVLALRFEERLRQVLAQTQEGRAILDQYFRVGDALNGVMATVATRLAPFEVVAALWDGAATKMSLEDFTRGESVLVLGTDESTRTALDAINRVLVQRLSELISSGDETRTRQTWLFLDEVREAGRLDGLSRLMTKGRSKGACVVLGFQAIEGMREVYGQNVADEIVGLCNNKAILRLESPASAQWASDLFGKSEVIDTRLSRSRSSTRLTLAPTFSRSRTQSEHRVTRDSVLASEIMTLPATGPRTGLPGYFISRSSGARRVTVPWNVVMSKQPLRSMDKASANRGARSQYLREWTAEDHDRLGLSRITLAKTSDAQPTPERRPPRRLRQIG